MNKELLKVSEVAREIEVPISTIQKHIREGKLHATKNGREYLVTRRELNKYLGIENNDEILKKDLEIAKLKQELKTYEMKFKIVSSVVNQVKVIVE